MPAKLVLLSIARRDAFPFESKPKQFIAERDVYHILLENGESYIFKPARNENLKEDRTAYVPQVELAIYEKFKQLQGKYIPICYGIAVLHGQVGLLLEKCGRRTLEYPPQNDENAKFILYMQAIYATERCLAAGLVHQDPDFRNLVYDPDTLRVWIINFDQEKREDEKPEDVWAFMDGDFSEHFDYHYAPSGFRWGLICTYKALLERPFELSLYILVLHHCFCLVKKKMIERLTHKFNFTKDPYAIPALPGSACSGSSPPSQ